MSNADALAELQKLAPGAIVVLYQIDATEIGGSTLYLHPGTNGTNQALTWQGQDYTPYPIEVRGYEFKGQGTPPRPSLFIGNVASAISALCQAHDDLIGAKVTRKRTFARFLDGMPEAANVSLPDDVFFIERKTTETRHSVEFELTTRMIVDGVLLPKRRVLANLCGWRYRGEGCGFTGAATADFGDTAFDPVTDRGAHNPATAYVEGDAVYVEDTLGRQRWYWCHTGHTGHTPPNTNYWTADDCSKRINGCQLRFPDILPYGAFPNVQRG